MQSEVYNQSICVVIRVAEMYFFEGFSQKEIAADLNISISTVSRLLKRAKEEGIIRYVMPDAYRDCVTLEKVLIEKYGLDEVMVVPPIMVDSATPAEFISSLGEYPADYDYETKKRVAREGARYIQRVITSKDTLGIAWGGTMYELIQYLNPCRKASAKFVTLHGSITSCSSKFEVNTLVNRIAMAFGGKRYAIAYPGLQESKEERDRIRELPEVKEVFDLFDDITISVSGIGSFYPEYTSPLSRLSYLSEDDLEELSKSEPYGDMMIRFIDKDGNECDSDLSDRTLAIEMETYKKIPRRVLAVSGVHKAYTVDAALKGGLSNILIADYTLASKIAEL